MKNIFVTMFVSFMAVFAAEAQTITNKSAFGAGELVELSGSGQEYYAEKEAFYKDENGLISGKLHTFHLNGNIEETGTLIKSKRYGAWLKYDEAGNIIAEAHYINGIKDGVWKVWDSNGTLRLQFAYDNGKRTGEWLMFDENGLMVNKESY